MAKISFSERMKQWKDTIVTFFKEGDWTVFGVVLGVHIAVGLIHLLANHSGHPLSALLKPMPLAVKIIVVTVYCVLIYIIPGYLLVIAFHDKKRLLKNTDFSLVMLFLLFFTLFVFSYLFMMFKTYSPVWRIYSFINPVMGTFSDRMMNSSWTSIFWIIGTCAPSFGLLTGIYLRCRGEDLI